jgi:hypothetical protein
MRRSLAVIVIGAVVVVVVLFARAAEAKRGVRPLFEPTDLELEDPGIVEIDLQGGLVRSQGPWRLVLPDLELDVGLLRWLEFDLDAAYALNDSPPGSFKFTDPAPDNLWPAAKVGLWDWVDEGPDGLPATADDVVAWALGAQVGPKIPVAPGSHGLGFEALLLVGHVIRKAHFVLNVGAFVDPSPAAGASRPVGLELGLDFDRDLDASGHYQVTAELSGVRFLSSDPHQLLATAGLAWSPTPATQLSIVGLYGFLEGSDRYGALLGLTKKLGFFGAKPH